MNYTSEDFNTYLQRNHTKFNNPIENISSDKLKDYFFKNDRLPGKNLAITTLLLLFMYSPSEWYGADIKIGYNSNSCYVRLESNFTFGIEPVKEGS
jgi:hypothetical protein